MPCLALERLVSPSHGGSRGSSPLGATTQAPGEIQVPFVFWRINSGFSAEIIQIGDLAEEGDTFFSLIQIRVLFLGLNREEYRAYCRCL